VQRTEVRQVRYPAASVQRGVSIRAGREYWASASGSQAACFCDQVPLARLSANGNGVAWLPQCCDYVSADRAPMLSFPAMLNDIWLPALALGSISIPGLCIAGSRRRREAERAACPAVTTLVVHEEHQSEYLAPTIEAAERQLALLYPRMRAYLRDPYGYAESRITSEAAFEQCLELAINLNIRIGELSGASSAGTEERDRIRGLVLQGLLVSHRVDSRSLGPSTGSRPPQRRSLA
jgi:hypothetical protein